jgi:peptidoglycan/xylan/chitin deacetylase (PgdA/CDA1 family)
MQDMRSKPRWHHRSFSKECSKLLSAASITHEDVELNYGNGNYKIKSLKFYYLIIVLLFSSLVWAQQKQVCFSIDDLPVVSYGMNDTSFQKEITAKLIASFTRNHIPAIGFVIAKKLLNDTLKSPFQISLVERWIDCGFDIGNHTYSHPDYNSVSLKDYTNDLLKGEVIIKELLNRKGRHLKYFRHPYLHLGNTKLKADSLSDFLAQQGSTIAPVTIDTDDYLFALAYKRACEKNDTVLYQRIGQDYLAYMEKKILFYEQQAQALFARNIPQILLVHASWLNAEFMDSLALIYRSHGYTFINMEKALEDTVYQTAITAFGKWGISWLDRWALSWGKQKDFFKDDPVPPEYVMKLTK